MYTGIQKVRYFQNLGYKVYVYGAGLWGRNVYHELKTNGIDVDGFVVTKIDSISTLFEIGRASCRERV